MRAPVQFTARRGPVIVDALRVAAIEVSLDGRTRLWLDGVSYPLDVDETPDVAEKALARATAWAARSEARR